MSLHILVKCTLFPIFSYIRFFVLYIQDPYFIRLLLVASSCRLVCYINLWMTYMNACKKKSPLEMNFIQLGKKKIYCIFQTCCIISALFSTKCYLFHNFIFFCSNNIFFINHVLKFKYESSHLRVNVAHWTDCPQEWWEVRNNSCQIK